jgi:hypothetical protein
VTPEEPRAAAVRLQVPAEAKLIDGQKIRFLGLTSGGHERQFLGRQGRASLFLTRRNTSGSLARLNSLLRAGICP